MRYTIELDSHIMLDVIKAVDTRVTELHSEHMHVQRHYGRGHDVTVRIGRAVSAMKLARTVLRLAYEMAEPERATGTYDNASLQVGSDLPYVYGAPRRTKNSNLRRRSA